MVVLLNPLNPIRKSIKWALVAHTMAMFSVLTTPVVIELLYFSIQYIDDRAFPGNDESPPGPFGYQFYLSSTAASTVFELMFPLNQWLADGLLVGPILDWVVWAFNVGNLSSFIAATSSIP